MTQNAAELQVSIPSATPVPATPARLRSLDAFRGLTIAAMIVVNNPGNPDAVYWPLAHAEWFGWTPADLVFPFFLFIMGVSLGFSLERRRKTDSALKLARHILVRAVVLAFLGIALNGLFVVPWHQLRLTGVLQRIALVYAAASGILLTASRRLRILLIATILIGYWLLLTHTAAPGHAPGDLSPQGNLASWIDRQVFGARMFTPLIEPEGLLSTFPTLATALLGTLAADWFRSGRSKSSIVLGMLGAAAAATLAGDIWSHWFPISKNLWTSSYVLLTGGLALAALALCYWLIDVLALRRWAEPFVVFGVNPLALYFASGMASLALDLSGARDWCCDQFLESIISSPANLSLVGSLCFLMPWWLVGWLMQRKSIYIKI
jgi:predicted acyltransferase